VVGESAGAILRGDLWGCLRCVAAFVPLLLTPGLCLGWLADVAGFRRRATVDQLIWSLSLSLAMTPIAAVMLAKYWSLGAVLWFAIGSAAVGIGLKCFARRPDQHRRFSAPFRLILLLGAGWILFAVGELIDVEMSNRLYMSVPVFDHALRTAFVDAAMRGGVPPANPLYWPGHAAPMRYYYFWYVVTAAAARLAGATARQAMSASAVWAGLGLAAAVDLYCRHFLGDEGGGGLRLWKGVRWPRAGLALGLLAVTGLDILPAIAKGIARLPTDADPDWWSFDQVGSWMDSVLWVPHHIAGLVCCLTGFLLVWMSKAEGGWRRWVCGVVAGESFASAFGQSTWVALAFALVMAGWMVWVVGWERDSRVRLPVMLAAGLVAAVALLPYLAELRHDASGVSAASAHVATGVNGASEPTGGTRVDETAKSNQLHLLRFGVRHMIDPDALLALPRFARLAQSNPRLEDAIAGLVLLLPGYFLEFGFYGLALLAAVGAARRGALGEAERTALALVGVGLLVSSFLRSTVVVNNDFGIRSILIVQFFLLLLAVQWCEGGFGEAGKGVRATAAAMLWLGLAGTAYQAMLLRVYLPVEERLGRPAVAGLSKQAMALRWGFAAMDGRVPKDAVVQFNTTQPSDYFRYAQILMVGRQVAAALPECPAAFGGEVARCAGVEDGVAALFGTSEAGRFAVPADVAHDLCGRMGISYLIATQWDGVWADRAGWVWELPAVVDTGEVRAVRCGGFSFPQPG
jgi:hypothetical protein